ncbi:DUF4166 domain-containing protein [Agrilutibacter solisilvae]|uniref:DUF4166 domain-containing protein n=1 Tax=Agrilutibacter solisilvae TaxID=2763317 RepID=A0A974XZA0_9GAMM|nr:DUF4166 domain-containing protein [Lysobacter solisilvae]QSX78531.1 DUF4166 domain-containing protein [Lysobacter solisilvae]
MARDLPASVTPAAAAPIFPRLLGARFDNLPPTVRRLHVRPGLQRWRGEVEVERGRGWLSRLCAWATRLPPAGRGPIVVDIDAAPEREQWTRHVAGHAMRSTLRAERGLLCERLGLVEFGFVLDAADGVLLWRVARVRALGVPLPARWFDQVVAREFERDGRYGYDVAAHLPLAGLLVHYRGWLDGA